MTKRDDDENDSKPMIEGQTAGQPKTGTVTKCHAEVPTGRGSDRQRFQQAEVSTGRGSDRQRDKEAKGQRGRRTNR